MQRVNNRHPRVSTTHTMHSIRIASHTPHLSAPLRHYVRAYVNSTFVSKSGRETGVSSQSLSQMQPSPEQHTAALNQYHLDRAFALSWAILEISNWHSASYRTSPHEISVHRSDWMNSIDPEARTGAQLATTTCGKAHQNWVP